MAVQRRKTKSKPKAGSRTPLFFAHPDDLKTEEQRDAFAASIGDMVVEMVNEVRRRDGKPPLKED